MPSKGIFGQLKSSIVFHAFGAFFIKIFVHLFSYIYFFFGELADLMFPFWRWPNARPARVSGQIG